MTDIFKSNKVFDASELNFEFEQNDNSSSYKKVTNDIEIIVRPEFINSQAGLLGDLYIWSYNIKIRNLSDKKVRLINRHWKIVDEKGGVQKVDGEGVVGKQPDINKAGVFEYNSGVHLTHPSGIMSGYYEMMAEDGEKFDVEIPSFSLDVPSVKYSVN